MSHLDLMRLFQRAFKRAGLPLTHTQGYNPRPLVSIALPLSVGVESECELLDFELDGLQASNDEIKEKLNAALVQGVRVLAVYDSGRPIKELTHLSCEVTMEYDRCLPDDAKQTIEELFARPTLLVEKKSKNGVKEQDIIPMMRNTIVEQQDGHIIQIRAVITCQNPSMNPMQIVTAVERYLPELTPDFAKCNRIELYDANHNEFR
jgi:radical SAM-linked protein